VDLLEKLLELNPHKRISALEALRHPYFKDIHEPKLEIIGKTFDLSFEFDQTINTKFGVRHMLFKNLIGFHKQTRQKEKEKYQKNC